MATILGSPGASEGLIDPLAASHNSGSTTGPEYIESSVIAPPRAWRRHQATPDAGTTAPPRERGRSWGRRRLPRSERGSPAGVARPPRGWRAPGPGLRLAGRGPARLAPARVARC